MEFDMKEALARRRKEETMLRFTKFSHYVTLYKIFP